MNKKYFFAVLILVLIALGLGFYFAFLQRTDIIPEEENNYKQTVKLYYYNPEEDKDETGNIMCSKSGLVFVEREVIKNSEEAVIEDTIGLLLKGDLTKEETEIGITTEYPLDGLELEDAVLENGTLTLQFNDPNGLTNGGACRVGILWFQISETAKQFSGVETVRFEPQDGLFQP